MTLPPDPIEDTDKFDEKIALLLDDPVPMVSFTFGIPPRSVIAALQQAGSVVVQTVTTAEEAAQARDAGADMLAVQAAAAGGHSGTLSPRQPLTPVPIVDLVKQIVATVGLPVLAAGGLATPGCGSRRDPRGRGGGRRRHGAVAGRRKRRLGHPPGGADRSRRAPRRC